MGILVGLLSAVSHSGQNIFLKALSGMGPNFLTFVRMTSAVPPLAILVSVFGEWAVPPKEFWFIIVFIAVPCEIAIAYCMTRALHLAPISITAPLAAFTSIFLIPIGYCVFGELPTTLGLVGIVAIVIGSFFLAPNNGNGFIGGLRASLREKGILFALASAFIASITISFAKLTFQYAPPILSAFYLVSLLAIVLAPFLSRQTGVVFKLYGLRLLGLSATSGLTVALHYLGLSLLPAVYFTSLKRLSILVDVVAGGTIFKEVHISTRLTGASLMVGGVILIAIG